MAQVNSYEGRVGFLKNSVSALADNGTATIQLPATCNGRFQVGCISSAGVVIPNVAAGGTGFSVAYNSTTKVITFTNETGAAFTGDFTAVVLD